MFDRTRTQQVLADLVSGITQLTSSDTWRAWLDVQSRFRTYSFNNTMLIHLQRDDAARVAGFRAWRDLGRSVRKGEKAIWILAPVTRKATGDASSEDDNETRQVLVGFKPVAVFDVAQTDGDDLPEIVTRLQGPDNDDAYGQLTRVAHTLGYTVEDGEFTDTRHGDCNFSLRRIRVASDRSPAQRVKTLAHELAHATLHERATDRAIAELEAESIAYIVCAQLGLDSGGYTFGYVTGWAGGGDEAIAAIRAAGNRIQKGADTLLAHLGETAAAPAPTT